jgi:hypothetical protein
MGIRTLANVMLMFAASSPATIDINMAGHHGLSDGFTVTELTVTVTVTSHLQLLSPSNTLVSACVLLLQHKHCIPH